MIWKIYMRCYKLNKLEKILGIVTLTTSLIGCTTLPQQEPIYDTKQYVSIGQGAISQYIITLRGYIPFRPTIEIEYKDNYIYYTTRWIKINSDDFYTKHGHPSHWSCLQGDDEIKEEVIFNPKKKYDGEKNHNLIVMDLEKRLLNFNSNRIIKTEYEYSVDNHCHEADILCIDRDRQYAYAFEVKSSYGHENKQKWQLRADYDCIRQCYNIPPNRIHLFKVTGHYPDYNIKEYKWLNMDIQEKRQETSTQNLIYKILSMCDNWISYNQITKKIHSHKLRYVLNIMVDEEFLERFSSGKNTYYRIKKDKIIL